MNESLKKKWLSDEKSKEQVSPFNSATEPESLVTIKSYVTERQGERDSMQDRHVILHEYLHFFKTKPTEL